MAADSTPPPRAAFDAPRLRILWSFARPHRRTLAVGLLLALAGSALGLATPMITKWVLDALNDSASLTGPVTALFVLLVVGAAVSYRQWCMLGAVGERVVLEARESMVRRFLRATVPALTRRPTGELVTRVTSDTVLLREAAAQSFVGLVNGAVMLVGSLVLMGVLDLVLLATTMAAVAVTAALFALLMPGIGAAQQRSQEHIGRLGGLLEGTLRAIRTVKVSRAEERAAERIMADARSAAEFGIRARPPGGAGLDGRRFRHPAGHHRDPGHRGLAGRGGEAGGLQPDRLPAVRVHADGAGHHAQPEPDLPAGRNGRGRTHPADRRPDGRGHHGQAGPGRSGRRPGGLRPRRAGARTRTARRQRRLRS
ncbi:MULTISPECIES: ABC transporter ATP-binding protein [unclassified Streptomyces]|uniref:ABC transporter ATP-binding protein n=1 Tax=unclassified Streptomyces TaxID=2593676 RepID=UPI000A8B49E2|nr:MULTISPECIES: ABC transporter ATP-binding protein [unclassified Streptomyces]